MRTTLTIDDDVLAAARHLAQQQNRTIGEVISELVRAGLKPDLKGNERNGLALVPQVAPDRIVTPDLVRDLADDEA